MPIVAAGSTNISNVPNIYVQIVSPTPVIQGVPTGVIGIVGTASWGPINAPTAFSGSAQGVQLFGNPSAVNPYDLITPVLLAELQGANSFIGVRVVDGTDTAAFANLLDTQSPTPGVGAVLTSLYTGSLGNNTNAIISNGSGYTPSKPTYKLTIYMNGGITEVFDAIDGSPTQFWGNLVNAVNMGQSVSRGPSQLVLATLVTGDEISGVIITNPGSYSVVPTISLSGPGSGAILLANMFALNSTSLANSGDNYAIGDIVTFADGTATSATQITVNSILSGISSVFVTDAGSYTVAPTVTAFGGSGSGAVLVPHLSMINSVLSDGGSDYVVGEIITLASGTHTSATTIVVDSIGSSIDSINVTAPGLYNSVPTASIVDSTGTGAVLVNHMEIVQSTLSNPGDQYAVADTILLDDGTHSVQAEVTIDSIGTPIESIAITDPGSYIILPTATVIDATGSGAVLSTHMNIVGSSLNAQGNGYAIGDTILLDNGTFSEQAEITVDSIGAGIASLTITAPGSYTNFIPHASVVASSGSGAGFTTRLSVISSTLASGGTGYAINNTLNLESFAGSTPVVITVDTVGGGGNILTYTVSNAGDYANLPTNPVIQTSTSGTGTGATFNLTWGVLSVTVDTPGSNYPSDASIVFTGSGGVSATPNFTATGTILTYSSTILGDYTALPTNPVVQESTSGIGTGAQFNLNWGVLSLDILTAGINYSTSAIISFSESGGAIAIPSLFSAGRILTYTVTNTGDYTAIPTDPVNQDTTSGSGIGAQFNLNWGVLSVAVSNPGAGYSISSTVNFSGTGGAAATVVLGTGGEIVTYHIQNTGNYTVLPSNPVNQGSTSGIGTGAAVIANWGVSSVAVTSSGSGYPLDSFITFSGSGGAVASPILADTGEIALFSVTRGGSYSVIPTNPIAQGSTSGSGAGATFNALWGVSSVTVTNHGEGYDESSVILFSPSGAVGNIVFSNLNSPKLQSYTLDGGTDGNTNVSNANLVGVNSEERTGMYALAGTQASLIVLSNASDPTYWSLQEEFANENVIYMMGTLSAGFQDNINGAITLKQTSGVNSPYFKLMQGDWVLFNDQYNNVQRYASPQGVIAGVLAAQSPGNSCLNKIIRGIIGTQKSIESRSYSDTDLESLQTNGIEVITLGIPTSAFSFGARFGINTSSNNQTNHDNYPRMVYFLGNTLSQNLGNYIGLPQTTTLRQEALATLNAYLQTLADPNRPGGPLLGSSAGGQPYLATLDDSNNPVNSVLLGNMIADVQAAIFTIVLRFVINLSVQQAPIIVVTNQTSIQF